MALNDVMFDLETLSREPGAVVLCIAAVRFDPRGTRIADEFSLRLPAQEQIDAGAHVEFETLRWWMRQSQEARAASFDGPCAQTVAEGLHKFGRYLARIPAEKLRLWSNGPSFDGAQLRRLYQRAGVPWPVRYNAERDCRTLYEYGCPCGLPPAGESDGVAHRAIDDTIAQAKAVQFCLGGKAPV